MDPTKQDQQRDDHHQHQMQQYEDYDLDTEDDKTDDKYGKRHLQIKQGVSIVGMLLFGTIMIVVLLILLWGRGTTTRNWDSTFPSKEIIHKLLRQRPPKHVDQQQPQKKKDEIFQNPNIKLEMGDDLRWKRKEQRERKSDQLRVPLIHEEDKLQKME